MEHTLHKLCAQRAAHETHTFVAMLEQLKYFAGRQIRNTASVGGNIVTGSPISDLNPLYMAAGAIFTVVGEGSSERKVGSKSPWPYLFIITCRNQFGL